ncbi:cytochrome P450 [Streptomyces sp. NPDC059037]|uniref:cytochrome P450 n=1 Tax=Streptomyces sp. NPDC059037 TaxID=3346710 RepID=UPI00368BA40C
MTDELAGLYEQMRAAHGNVVPVTLDGGVPAWLVIGYAEITEVCRREELFSRDSRTWREWQENRIPADWALLPQIAYLENARFMSGDEHRRLRSILFAGLSRADQGQIRRFIEQEADRLIDRFCASGRADIIADYAAPLPLLVMLSLMGLPPEAGQQLMAAVAQLLAGREDAQRANAVINTVLERAVAERRARPRNDFISFLTHGPVTTRPLSDQEVVNQAWLTTVAAAGAATNWIANVMEQLVRKSRLHSLLAAGTATIDQIMTEALWENPPVQNVAGAYARRDVVLGGQAIAQGDMLVLGLAGANADPTLTRGLDRDAYTLTNESHMAWGAGAHTCPAQQMARVMVRTSIGRFLHRCWAPYLDDVDQPLDWGPSVIVRALRSLPIAFDPSPRRGAPLAPDATALGDTAWTSRSLFPHTMLQELTASARS